MKWIQEKIEGKSITITYTVLFFLLLLIGLLPLEIRNSQPLFSGLFVHHDTFLDGLKQHIFFMNDYVGEIKGFLFEGQSFNLYRFDIGMGSDFVTSYAYYSLYDPITLIAYIIPLEYIEISYSLMILVRVYLTGYFMMLFLKYLGITKKINIILPALFYALSYTVLFSAVRHPMFINGPMYLPLVILGIYKVYDRKSPVLLIISVFLALISQFYFAVYTLVGAELFILITALISKEPIKDRLVSFIRVNLYILLGVLISGFMLFPQFFSTIGGSRVGTKGFKIYNEQYYIKLINSLILPTDTNMYTSTIGNILVFFTMMLYMFKNKFKDVLSIIMIVLTIFVLISYFGYALNVFSYINNRWTYLIVFFVTIMLSKHLNDTSEIGVVESNQIIKTIIFLVVCILSFWITSLLTGYLLHANFTYVVYIIGCILVCISFGVFIFKVKLRINVNFNKITKYYYPLFVLLIVVTVVSISVNYFSMITGKDGFSMYYYDEDRYSVITNDDSFYRVEQKEYEVGVSSFSNDGIYYGYPSTSLYNTMNNGYVINSMNLFNVNNENNSVGYNGFDFRGNLLLLNNVKYLIIRDSENMPVPKGYSLHSSVRVEKYDETLRAENPNGTYLYEDGVLQYENANIYINNNQLNFGVLYSEYLLLEERYPDYSSLKDTFLLDYVFLDEPAISGTERGYNTRNTIHRVGNFVTDGVIFHHEQLIVSGAEGTITFKTNSFKDSELYVSITGLYEENIYNKFITKYQVGEYVTDVVHYAYASNMFVDNSDHLVNMGYYETEGIREVTITLEKGTYDYESIGYHIVDRTNYEQDVSEMNDDVLKNVEFNGSGFKADIEPNSSGILYLPVVYHEGFKIYVDGIEREKLLVNGGFIGTSLFIDDETIELVYKTPGQILGNIISVCSVVMLFGIIVIKRSSKWGSKL